MLDRVKKAKREEEEEEVEEMEGEELEKGEKNKDVDKSFVNVLEKEDEDEDEDEKAKEEAEGDEDEEDEEKAKKEADGDEDEDKSACPMEDEGDEEDEEKAKKEEEDDDAESEDEKEFDVNDESDIFLDDEDEMAKKEAEGDEEDEEKAKAKEEAEGDEDDEDKEKAKKEADGDEDEEDEEKAKKEADGDEDEEDEEKEKKEMKKPKLDVEEDVTALFNGETLSEEFKTKAKTILESSVRRKVIEYATNLKARYNKKLQKAKKTISEKLVSKVDNYLDYVVEEWMNENKLAVQSALRTEITEEFITDLRSLFENHNIMIPKGKEDLVETQAKKIEGLKKDLDQEIKKSVSLRKKLNEQAKVATLREICEGMTDTEIEKFKSLVDGVVYDESYKEKLLTIKENYISKKVKSKDSFEPVVGDNGEKTEITGDMKAIVDTLSKLERI
jgi:hypothetical protein